MTKAPIKVRTKLRAKEPFKAGGKRFMPGDPVDVEFVKEHGLGADLIGVAAPSQADAEE